MRALSLLFVAALVWLPRPAQAVDFQLRGRTALQINMQHNAVDPLLSFLPASLAASLFDSESGNYDTQYLLAWLELRGAVTFMDRISIVATLDTTAVTWEYFGGPTGSAQWTGTEEPAFDGLSGADALAQAAFVREVYAEAVLGARQEVHLSLGKHRSQVLGGFFYDDYGLEAMGQWDFWSKEEYLAFARGYAVLPYRYLPDTDIDLLLVGAEVVLRDLLFQSIRVGAFYLRDRENAIHDLVRQGHATDLLANDLTAQGLDAYFAAGSADAPVDLGTFYLEGTLDLNIGIFHGLVALQVGRGEFPVPPEQDLGRGPGPRERPRANGPPARPRGSNDGGDVQYRGVDFLGHLALGEMVFAVAPKVSVTPYVLSISGLEQSDAGEAGRFTVFCSLVPYVKGYATILLTGGFGELYSGREQELLGMGTGGLVALGASINADPGPRVSLGLSGTLLGSNRSSDPFVHGNYGVELDSVVKVALWSGFQAHGEVDLLIPGDYFPSREVMVVGLAGVRGAF